MHVCIVQMTSLFFHIDVSLPLHTCHIILRLPLALMYSFKHCNVHYFTVKSVLGGHISDKKKVALYDR